MTAYVSVDKYLRFGIDPNKLPVYQKFIWRKVPVSPYHGIALTETEERAEFLVERHRNRLYGIVLRSC